MSLKRTENTLLTMINTRYGTQKAFAEKIDVPTSTLGRAIHSDISTVSVDVVYKICTELQLNWDELLGTIPGIDDDAKEARKLYRLYKQRPEMQQAVNSLLGYQP